MKTNMLAFLLTTLFVSLTACREARRGIVVAEQRDTLNQQKLDPTLQGIERKGRFVMYKQSGLKEHYTGNSKIEFLNENGLMVRTIEAFDDTRLFGGDRPSFSVRTDSLAAQGYYDVSFPKTGTEDKYVNAKLFDKTLETPVQLLLELSYDVQYGKILSKYTYYTFERGGMDIYGAGFEVVIHDSLGNEFGRISGVGNILTADMASDSKILYVSTGGMLNEDARHPTAFYAFDIASGQVLFTREEKNGECISGGRDIMLVLKTCGNNETKEIYLFDQENNVIYYSEDLGLCAGKSIFMEGKTCYCFINRKEHLIEYKKNFKTQTFKKL